MTTNRMKEMPHLHREAIKYLAVLAMTLDHIALMLLPESPGAPAVALLQRCFLSIGSFTAPVMIYFLIEGWFYTRSRRRYALRLFLVGLLSQPVFGTAFHVTSGNMLLTLLICLGVLYVYDTVAHPWHRGELYGILFLLGLLTDWSGMAVPFVLLLRPAFRVDLDAEKKKTVYVDPQRLRRGMLYCWGYDLVLSCLSEGLPEGICETAGLALGFWCIAFLYDRKRAARHRKFHQWFFYLYYPLHLLLLLGIRQLVGSGM